MGGSSLGHSVKPADGVYWPLAGLHLLSLNTQSDIAQTGIAARQRDPLGIVHEDAPGDVGRWG